MAVYCKECRCVFSRGHINCPFCGSQSQTDSRTVQELVDSGFRLVPARRQLGGNTGPGLETQPFGGGSDALERLRRAYQIDGTRPQAHAAPASGDTRTPPADSPPPALQERGADPLEDWLHGSTSGGIAAAGTVQGPYRTVPPEPVHIPPVPPPDPSSRHEPTREDRELRRLRRSQRAYQFRSGVSSFFKSLALLPWNWIFWILLVIAVIFLIRAFIIAIPMLLNSALNLILSVFPTISVILIIIWIIRNMFRP